MKEPRENHLDSHEVWWIYAPERHPWGGLRIAHFRKSFDGTPYIFISDEVPDRVGPRIWEDVASREGWVKVKQVLIPTKREVDGAVDSALREIATKIKHEAGFE